MFVILLTLVLLYAIGANLMALGTTEILHMGGRGSSYFLWPIGASILSYAAIWFARNKPYIICGALINLAVGLALRPLQVDPVVCVLYSLLWLTAALEVARGYGEDSSKRDQT
jgi:hypothetical protein